MASWLVHSSPDRAVRVRALAGDIVLCSWARHLTLTVPLSTQVHKWVPEKLMLGVSLRGVEILLGRLARMQTLPFTFSSNDTNCNHRP